VPVNSEYEAVAGVRPPELKGAVALQITPGFAGQVPGPAGQRR